MKTNLLLNGLTIILVTMACTKDAPVVDLDVPELSTQTVSVMDQTLTNQVGTSKLDRYKDRIKVEFSTSNLIPGHAYTLWWVIWNKPEACSGFPGPCVEADFALADQVEVEVLYATGQLAGADGKATFKAQLRERQGEGSINSLFEIPSFGGMYQAETAEVHLVLRSHGPQIPGQVNHQLSSYGGGCSKDLPPFTEVPDEVGECADIHASVHQVK